MMAALGRHQPWRPSMGPFYKKAKDLIGRVNFGGALFGGLAVFCMCLTITYDVILRYFFNRPTQWAVEVGELLMLPTVFLAAALVLRDDGHIRADILYRRITGFKRIVLDLALYIMGLAWSFVLLWEGWQIFYEFLKRGKTTPSAELPTYPPMFLAAVGCTFLVIECLFRIGDTLRKLRGHEFQDASVGEKGGS